VRIIFVVRVSGNRRWFLNVSISKHRRGVSAYTSPWLYSRLDLYRFFSFIIFTHSAELLGLGISPLQDGYLHTKQHKHRINLKIHASSGIQIHDHTVGAAKDGSCLRPRGLGTASILKSF
jgi:hypothetical protein